MEKFNPTQFDDVMDENLINQVCHELALKNDYDSLLTMVQLNHQIQEICQHHLDEVIRHKRNAPICLRQFISIFSRYCQRQLIPIVRKQIRRDLLPLNNVILNLMVILVTNKIITDVNFFASDANLQHLPDLVVNLYMSLIKEKEHIKEEKTPTKEDDSEDENNEENEDMTRVIDRDYDRNIINDLDGYYDKKELMSELNRGHVFDPVWIRQALEVGIMSIRQGMMNRILSNALRYEIHCCQHDAHFFKLHQMVICNRMAIIDEFCAGHTSLKDKSHKS